VSATATPRPTRSEPEGHAVRYNAADDVIGLTIVDVH
jgi:hypothetical protein